jgi:N-acetylmuramic acid 6-phosphate etherase
LETERLSPRYAGIDLWEADDLFEGLLEGQFSAVAAVRGARPEILRAALATEERLRTAGRLIYAGAGTSARLAVQDGAELMPTFGWPPDRVLLFIAGGHEALLRSMEGAEDQVEYAAQLVRDHRIGAADVLVAVAASGTTPFTLACLRQAKAASALTIGIANNQGTPLLREADCPILLDTGPEPIAGSTRMKAGTSQRVALLVLSSFVMIRLGHVYGGLMIDVQASNEKLARRTEAILQQLTDRPPDEVRDALLRAKGSIKTAVLLLQGCELGEAGRILASTNGRLREALATLDKRKEKRSLE